MEALHHLPRSLSNNPNLKDPPISILFRRLHIAFHRFFFALPLLDRSTNHDPHTGSDPDPNSRIWPIVQDLSLILRCSLLLLTLPNIQHKILSDKSRYILRALNPFLSFEESERHGTTFLRFRNFLSDVDMELSDSCRPFLCAVLEVFADELLRHKSLRGYLMLADSASSISEKLFVCHSNYGDTASLLEVISTHFILSVSSEKAFEKFISRLFLHCSEDCRFPELSLEPATVLLLDPIVLSAPKMLQAHVISLISDVIGSGLSSENLALDMDCYLITFQKSVILYSMQVSSLQIDGFFVEQKHGYNSHLLERGRPTFESHIQQVTCNRLNQVLSQSYNSWDSNRCKISSKTKTNLLNEYIAFMKERQYIFSDSCSEMAASILDCLIRQTFSRDAAGDVFYIKENTSGPDICLLASILKLMSVSLIQGIKCLSNSGDLGCLKTLGSTSVHEKYDFILSIVDHFQQIKFCSPIQTFLYNAMKSQQTNYNVSRLMLVHFSGLLSLSFSSGFDLLAKGCISVIMAVMYLFVFEEGDLVALGFLRGLPLRSCSSGIPSDKTGEGAGDKPSIYKLAAQFHRIRTRNLSTDSITSNNLVEDETEETCNGGIFLDCVIEDSKRLSDYGELADFLECKTSKNYSSWLKGRQIIRKKRYEKLIDLRKIKMKTIWKSMKSKKIDNLLKHWK